MSEVWDGNGYYYTTPAEVVVRLVNHGGEVDYQPGDGTRYLCALAYESFGRVDAGNHAPVSRHRRWLMVINLGICIDLRDDVTLEAFCRLPKTQGTWAALRPVLYCLNATVGHASAHSVSLEEYDFADTKHEADARTSRNNDGEELDRRDARLGRELRRLVEAGQ